MGNREPSKSDDRADLVVAGTEGVLIKNLESFCLRNGLKSTGMLMHVISVGETILQGESKRLCSHKARRQVLVQAWTFSHKTSINSPRSSSITLTLDLSSKT